MNDEQLFVKLKEYYNFSGSMYPSKNEESEDKTQTEFQNEMWKRRPFVENLVILKKLGLQENDQRVRVLDSQNTSRGELQLIHYIADNDGDIDTEVGHIRGLVYFISGEDVELVAKSFPKTEEVIYSTETEENLTSLIKEFKPTKCVVAHEGTILRLFYADGEWRYSTHRKINGLKSRWSGQDFGTILNRLLPNIKTEELNRDYCYVLLLEDTNTNLVCNEISGTVYHTITYDTKTEQIVKPLNIIGSVAENVPVDTESILNKVKNINPRKECGVLLANNKGEYLKIMNQNYYLMRCFRGVEHSVTIRYLQHRIDGMSQYFRHLLPQYTEKFDEVERCLPLIPEYLGHLWYFRDYKGNFLQIEQKCFETMRSCGLIDVLSDYKNVTGGNNMNLLHVRDLIIQKCRYIENSRHINNIVKLIRKEYQQYHDTQPEWSVMFE